MKETIVHRDAFITTQWAGGETTQLAIHPENALFSERDFLWRISSATFTTTQSVFSDFSGYQRYLLPLRGNLRLSHERLFARELAAYEPAYFDGAWPTASENSPDCIDYNFIVKNGTTALLQVLQEGDEHLVDVPAMITCFSVDDMVIHLKKAGVQREISGFSLYMLETEAGESVSVARASAPVILTKCAAG
ncbi:HutD family protein [Anoxynatronum buryatiense]|uniref:HutD protein n=1 Tax=Anoxynatronum buryatiense TaxID=489973 RepID=A0AA45WYG3_9CLOT|nr:HutD family protein [Anoxynatronum buryatiense]SMP68772.1 HutD protein [Anoxynatronum buryatiense]